MGFDDFVAAVQACDPFLNRLRLPEQYGIARILVVGSDEAARKNWAGRLGGFCHDNFIRSSKP